jgi:hypothetical protein
VVWKKVASPSSTIVGTEVPSTPRPARAFARLAPSTAETRMERLADVSTH